MGKRAGVVSAALHLCLLCVSFAAHIATCPALVLSACRCISVAASGEVVREDNLLVVVLRPVRRASAVAAAILWPAATAGPAFTSRSLWCWSYASCVRHLRLLATLELLQFLVHAAALLNFAIDQYCMFCDVNCAAHNGLSNCTHSIFAHRTLRRTWHPQNVVTMIIEDASRCVILRRTPRRWRPRTSFRVP